MDLPLNVKLKGLNRRLKDTDIALQLANLTTSQPAQIQAVQGVAAGIKGTELEGLPFTIALLKAKLLPDKAIAEELDIPLRAVRKYTQVHGFQTLMSQLTPCIWSDLILAAQATLMHHLAVEKNLEAAKWLLESTNQVASSRPMTQNTNQTLILNGSGGTPLVGTGGGIDAPALTVENLAEAMFNRMTENQKTSAGALPPPPITISHE